MKLLACLVQFEVASCRVELFVLDHEWLGIAKVAEDVVVEEKPAFIHAGLLLTLTAHAQNRLESR